MRAAATSTSTPRLEAMNWSKSQGSSSSRGGALVVMGLRWVDEGQVACPQRSSKCFEAQEQMLQSAGADAPTLRHLRRDANGLRGSQPHCPELYMECSLLEPSTGVHPASE
jgi:hypothetical protein